MNKSKLILSCCLVLAFVAHGAAAASFHYSLDAYLPEKSGQTVRVEFALGEKASAYGVRSETVSATVGTNGFLHATVGISWTMTADDCFRERELTWFVDGAAVGKKQIVSSQPYALAAAHATRVVSEEPVVVTGSLTVEEDLNASSASVETLSLKKTDSSSATLQLAPPAGGTFALKGYKAELAQDADFLGPCQEIETVSIGPTNVGYGTVSYTAKDYGLLTVDLTGRCGSKAWGAVPLAVGDILPTFYPVGLVRIFQSDKQIGSDVPVGSHFEKDVFSSAEKVLVATYDSQASTGSWQKDSEGKYTRSRVWMNILNASTTPLTSRLTIPVSPGETYSVTIALAAEGYNPTASTTGLLPKNTLFVVPLNSSSVSLTEIVTTTGLAGSTMSATLGFHKILLPEVKK